MLSALKLRLSGATFAQIAVGTGYKSPQAAQYAVESILRQTLRKPAEEERTLDLERLDVMLFAIWARVLLGDGAAIDRALGILARRAKLLGLDPKEPTVNQDNRTLIVGGTIAELFASKDGHRDGGEVLVSEYRNAVSDDGKRRDGEVPDA